MFCKKDVLDNFAKFTQDCNFIKKETGTDVFPVNFEKFLRATFFYRTPPVTVSTYLFLSCRNR